MSHRNRTISKQLWALLALTAAALALALASSALAASGGRTGFGFKVRAISGFPVQAEGVVGALGLEVIERQAAGVDEDRVV